MRINKEHYKKWLERNSISKNYAHFDKRVNLKKVINTIRKPEYVAKHGFYPFITYTKSINKYHHGEKKLKERTICYSSHIDRCIFQYYSFLINEKYNNRVESDGLNDVAVAYRNNLGKSNIDFSKTAFDFIRKFNECYILIGDFTGFFDNIDHTYLKERLCDLLNINNNILPEDYYAVYKNITNYSTWELKDLLELNKLKNNFLGIKKLNEQESVLTLSKFKKLKKQYLTKHNDKGIPQGSAISAVLANVYMLEADKEINNYVKSNFGMYMRYSDDFIVIIPCDNNQWSSHYKYITDILKKIPGVELEEKTQIFNYSDNDVKSYNSTFIPKLENGKNKINFLGFSFDGREVTIRDKTISKFYHRLYKNARNIKNRNYISPKGNRISCKKLYNKYSVKGSFAVKDKNGKYESHGNFISYVRRAQRKYGCNDQVDKVSKRHMRKIRKILNISENTR